LCSAHHRTLLSFPTRRSSDLVAAYPITPATEIVQLFSAYVADGLVDTEFVTVESEHSAMSACVGASTAGARVMTGTSSQGLILIDRKSTRLNSSHVKISYAVF